MDFTQFLTLLKQYGPLVAILVFFLFWFTRRIDALLDRNAQIYEGHIEHLWQTQERLLAALLGSQGSSELAPTMEDLKKRSLAKVPDKSQEGGQS